MATGNGVPEKNGVGGTGGSLTLHPAEMRTIRKIALHYPITEQDRQKTLQVVMVVLETAKGIRNKLAAAKTIAVLDSINVKREANEIEEERNDLANGAAVIRQAMKSPAFRESMAKLSDQACKTQIAPNPNGHQPT
jgi:hypothetical protein